MMTQSRRLFLWGTAFFFLMLSAACAPAAGPEPEAAAYPAGDMPTATPLPYPWPTQPPPPTEEPAATEEPLPADPPVPTLPPTPVVTPIPTAAPPIIPLPEGATAQPFSLYWRDDDVILTLRSEGQPEPAVFLDPVKEFGLYLTPEEAYGVAWGAVSPDGQTFALVLTEQQNPVASLDVPYPTHVYLFYLENGQLRPLVKHGMEPVWSPDGTRLAYVSTETGGLRIVSVSDGKEHEVRELYTPDRSHAHNVTDFSWSPGGRYLAVLDQVYFESTALYVVDIEQEGTLLSIIDSTPKEIYAPQWSPVNDRIVFLWEAVEQGSNIWMTNKDGSHHTQLSFEVGAFGGRPFWSPTGEWIAFSGPASFEGESPRYDLWLVDSTGLTLKRLTYGQMKSGDTPGNDALDPMWSPDGTQLVFRSASPDSLYGIWQLSLMDGNSRKLLDIGNSRNTGLLVAP